MPLRSFPFALRVGTDICNVSRVRRLVARKNGDRTFLHKFLTRVLTDPELTHFWERFGPQRDAHTKVEAISEYLAGRFAAKEAIRKACGHFDDTTRGFHHIMILPVSGNDRTAHKSQPPRGLILDEAYGKVSTSASGPEASAQAHADGHASEYHVDLDTLDGQLCEISISHDGDFATAVALVPTTPKTT